MIHKQLTVVFVALLCLTIPREGNADVCEGIETAPGSAVVALLLLTSIPAALAPSGSIEFGLGIGQDLPANSLRGIAIGGQNSLGFGRFLASFSGHFGATTTCTPNSYSALAVRAGYRVLDIGPVQAAIFLGPEFALPDSIGVGIGIETRYSPTDWFNVSLRLEPGFLSAGDQMDGFHGLATLPVSFEVSRVTGIVVTPYLSWAQISNERTWANSGGMVGVRFSH